MAVTLVVPPGVLEAAKVGWDDAADGLDGAWRRLSRSSTDGFSPAVAAAADAFQDAWTEEIKRRALQAQDHSDAFVEVSGVLAFSDAAAAEHARGLLGWVHRDVRIEGS